MKTGKFIGLSLLMAFLLLPGISHALTVKQNALVGLKGVYVSVEDMTPQAEQLGLNKDQIKADIELRLRKAGIRLLTGKEWQEMPGGSFFYVMVNTHSARVDLTELVTLARGFKTLGIIWHAEGGGTVRINKINEIRSLVGDLVDEFINDYLAANPK